MKKIGIMGGTFNPIHNGHLFLAENAYEQLTLDQILFMPSKNPPHKKGAAISSEEHRKNMVDLAIRDNPHFTLSTLELNREGVTYTADTLTLLTMDHPDTKYYFIEGTDSFLSMEKWKDPQTIFQLSTIVVAGRDRLPVEVLKKQKCMLEVKYGAKIELLDMPVMEISSEEVRNRIAWKQSIRYYVPDIVIDYIEKHNLYKNSVN